MNKSVNQIILDTIEKNKMIKQNDRIVVGVSGGADSMCLLHFLMSVREKFNIKIIVAHINHNLRGEESLRDQNMVSNFCKKNNLEFELLSVDINKISAKTNESSETCGRRIRYKFFNKICGENGKIATAHTLSDCCETMIFNLVRGTGMKGLTGIPKTRGNIIRPLISITRSQVEAYCSYNNIQYVTDSTNLENNYNRNKIRNIVVPVLKDINPSLENAFERFKNIAQEHIDLVNELSKDLIKDSIISDKNINGYNCNILKSANKTVLKQAIIKILNSVGCSSYEERHIQIIEYMVKNSVGTINLPNNFICKSSQGILRVYKICNQQVNNVNTEIIFPKSNAGFVINNQKINVKIISKQEFDKITKVNKLLVKNAIDYDIICGETVLRTRKSGDKFLMKGRGITKSLKKLFIEMKIPAENRDKILVVANNNEILWIKGIGISQRASVNKNTRLVAIILSENLGSDMSD